VRVEHKDAVTTVIINRREACNAADHPAADTRGETFLAPRPGIISPQSLSNFMV
jgi:hypothetical protein